MINKIICLGKNIGAVLFIIDYAVHKKGRYDVSLLKNSISGLYESAEEISDIIPENAMFIINEIKNGFTDHSYNEKTYSNLRTQLYAFIFCLSEFADSTDMSCLVDFGRYSERIIYSAKYSFRYKDVFCLYVKWCGFLSECAKKGIKTANGYNVAELDEIFSNERKYRKRINEIPNLINGDNYEF